MANPAKRKGDRVERQVVSLLNQAGIKAAKVSRCGHAGGDVYLELAPGGKRGLVAEVKARKEPIATIDNWLKGQSDLVVLKPDYAEPQIMMPWRTFVTLMEAYQGQPVFIDVRPAGESLADDTLERPACN